MHARLTNNNSDGLNSTSYSHNSQESLSENDIETNDECVEINKVFFFPDITKSPQQVMAQHFAKPAINGLNISKNYSPFDELLKTIESAKFSLDVCMYIITYPKFADVLIDAFKHRRIAVRIIIDSRENEAFSSQLHRIRESGIPVKSNLPSKTCLMHNKFVVIDERILITGSLNWTRAAFTENYDNVIATTHPDLVFPYIVQFQRMWQEFIPSVN
ncbi:mitochondrial cardiolipin hydrolase-like protein [Leptotrombidium deliense]|uniref:Mitochondrial cardiolipin hydrolase n=1 Tax=Leptotrombidium deliense TaxID=299467 RepID=A0A443SV05_9ACAR|nr:mitochondrial cardiolipin hydrolase-like protein [Leptotrombidium deliense]